jgi:hypothetical protein
MSSAFSKSAAVLCALLFLQGCLSTRMYVDPAGHRATYLSIRPREQPIPVTVSAEFQVNGTHKPERDSFVERRVEKVLVTTRIFMAAPTDASSPPAGALRFTLNNVGNIAAAAAKGAATGLTLGLVGSEVQDHFVLTAEYTPAGKATVSRTYEHNIYSTIGVHSELKNLTPVAPGDAGDQIIEDMVLNFLDDLQKDAVLARPPPHEAAPSSP